MTPDRVLAEDLVQTTMVRALERIDTFRGDSGLATWLHRILHNAFVDHVRRNRETPAEDVWEIVEERWRDDAYTLDPATLTTHASTVQDLRDALLRLPMMYRSAVALHDMEGLTVPQIARIQEIGLSAAKQRLHRGRIMLVSALAAGAERRAATQGVPMNCWDARTQVSDYLDRELDDRERKLLELHLQQCPTCPPLYSALVASREALTKLRDADTVIPPRLAARLGKLRQEQAQRRDFGDHATPATSELGGV